MQEDSWSNTSLRFFQKFGRILEEISNDRVYKELKQSAYLINAFFTDTLKCKNIFLFSFQFIKLDVKNLRLNKLLKIDNIHLQHMTNIINSPNMHVITNLKNSINDTTNKSLLIYFIGFPNSRAVNHSEKGKLFKLWPKHKKQKSSLGHKDQI